VPRQYKYKTPFEKPGKKRTSRISPALKRIAERGLDVSDMEIRTFAPRKVDMEIVQAMLEGAITYKEIAESTGNCPAMISQALKDPIACAWASQTTHKLIGTRLGQIDAAMHRRAVGGDVPAAKLMYDRYDHSFQRHLVGHVVLPWDPSKLSNSDLDAFLKLANKLPEKEEADGKSSESGHNGKNNDVVHDVEVMD